MNRTLPAVIAATLSIGIAVVVLASTNPTASAVTTPAVRSDISACPTTGTQLSGTPSGNTFTAATYNGNGATLRSGSYQIQSNTCIENYVFSPNAQLWFDANPSHATIVNNRFNGPDSNMSTAMPAVRGSDISINYNTFNGIGAAIGNFSGNNITFDHNDIETTPNGVDGMHFFFGNCNTTCNYASNVSVSYNKIVNPGRYPIELQYVVHGLRVLNNYITGSATSSGEVSVATGMVDGDNGVGRGFDSTGVEIGGNIVLNTSGYRGYGAGFEVYGSGVNVHDNYIKNETFGVIYASTAMSGQVPWYITNNTLVNVGGVSSSEGYGLNLSPTVSGNTQYTTGNAPPVPAWNYASGVQSGTGPTPTMSPSTTSPPTTNPPAPTTSAPTTNPPAPTTSAPATSTTQLGTNTVGGSTDNAGAGFRFGNTYTATTSGTVSDFRVYASGHGGGFVPVLYSVSSDGTAGALVAYGAPVTLGSNQSPGWITDKVAKGGKLTANSKYLLGVLTRSDNAPGSLQLSYDSTSSLTNTYIVDSGSYPVPAISWGTGGGYVAHAGYSFKIDEVPSPSPTAVSTAPPVSSSPAPHQSITTMGTTSVGRLVDNPGTGYRFGNIYQATKTGSLVDFKVYCSGSRGEFVPVLYQVTSGNVQTLVAYGNPVVLPVAQPGRWVTANAARPATIQAGNTYLVGLLVKPNMPQSALTLSYDSGVANNYARDTGNSYPMPQATWSSGGYVGTVPNSAYSFYVDEAS